MWLQGTPETDKYTVQIHADREYQNHRQIHLGYTVLYSTIQYQKNTVYLVIIYINLENIICHTWLHLNRIKITPSNKVC